MIALLRGINLANRHRVAMADLRELLEDAGFENVKTHLQSGNVLLDSTDKPAAVEKAIETALGKRYDFEIRVIVRTAAQLKKVVEADPLGKVATDPKLYLVAFLDGKPKTPDPADIEPEQYVVKGSEIYLWCPNGFQDSKLRKALTDKKLGVTVTTRNWRTVTKLNDLAASG
jgi:uncharacterized protein (DUF1697 family)